MAARTAGHFQSFSKFYVNMERDIYWNVKLARENQDVEQEHKGA